MKNLKRLLALLMCLAVLTTMLAGCNSNNGGTSADPSASASEPDASESPSADEPFVLNLPMPEELNTVDPTLNASAYTMQFITLTNMGLMAFDDNGDVTYGMADTYDMSEDGLTYTFHIRDDAYWTNGDKVTANDFLFSWQRLVDPEVAAPYAFMLGVCGVANAFGVAYGGAPMDTLGVSAPDESTFVVTLDSPKSYFLYLAALSSVLMPINEAFFNEAGDQFGLDIDNYLACGPFVISDWEVGATNYQLTKNEDFYDADAIEVDEINFSFISDAQQLILGWENDTLDYVNPLSGDYVSVYREDPALYLSDMAAMFFLSFNYMDESIANDNLRMALSLSIDKQAIVDNILNNGSRAADYIIPAAFAPDSEGVTFRENVGNPTYNTYDVDAAAAYWETAKEELGVDSLTLELLYNEDTVLSSVCAFLQSEWQNALPGLTIELKQTTYNNRLEIMGAGEYQVGLTRWYADYQDPLTYLDMWIATSSFNYGGYSNEAYDALYESVIGELALDEDGRIAAMEEMEAIILGDAAICPLYQLASASLQNPDYNWPRNVAGLVLYQFVSEK